MLKDKVYSDNFYFTMWKKSFRM